MTEMDKILQQMSELTETVKGVHAGKSEVDWESVKAEFSDQIDAKVAAEVQAKIDAMPVRRGSIEYAESVDKAIRAGELNGNRYAAMVKHIAESGKYKDFVSNEYKAVDLWLANQLMTKGHAYFPDRIVAPSSDLTRALKALSSTGTGTGDELVPTNMASELWEDVHLSNVLVSNIDRIPMTSNPMTVPNALGDVTFRVGTENVAFTSSDPATANQDLTVTELGAEVDWSYTLDEDAIVALMPAVRATISRNAGEYMDGFALNADATTDATGNINSDDGAPAADNYYISAGQDGIRHQWLVDNTSQALDAGGDALTDADITSTLALMGKYAADPRQILCVSDVWSYLRGFLNATTTSAPGTFVQNIQDVGFSIIVTGQIASYRGIPIVIPTLANRAEADGKLSVTAASNTLGSLSFLNRTQWKAGFQREFLVEVDRDIQKRQTIMVVSFRQSVGCRGTRSSATHTAGTYNILVT
jgi:HK97 family phage major capsid protein